MKMIALKITAVRRGLSNLVMATTTMMIMAMRIMMMMMMMMMMMTMTKQLLFLSYVIHVYHISKTGRHSILSSPQQSSSRA